MDLITEARQFRGPDGYVGFRQFRIYQLRYAWLEDGQVTIALDHLPAGGQLVVPAQRFEQWWVTGP
ncbi:MAG: hypothetical protein ACRYFX_26230 [Janthinobacterium lividum]